MSRTLVRADEGEMVDGSGADNGKNSAGAPPPLGSIDPMAMFSGVIFFDGRLSKGQMEVAATQMLRGQPVDIDAVLSSTSRRAKLTYCLDMKLNRVPRAPIAKMIGSKYAEAFLKEGRLRLGSIEYFRSFEHSEIGDPTEGEAILIGLGKNNTQMRRALGGLNEWVFCTFAGEPDPKVIEQFGYDAAVLIKDPAAFASAIARAIGALAFNFGRCAYTDSRTLVGGTDGGPPAPGYRIDHRVADLVGPCRALLKPERYQHQKEFRFIWAMPQGVKGVLDIACPEAAQHCELIKL